MLFKHKWTVERGFLPFSNRFFHLRKTNREKRSLPAILADHPLHRLTVEWLSSVSSFKLGPLPPYFLLPFPPFAALLYTAKFTVFLLLLLLSSLPLSVFPAVTSLIMNVCRYLRPTSIKDLNGRFWCCLCVYPPLTNAIFNPVSICLFPLDPL